jgi:ribonuclease VapC
MIFVDASALIAIIAGENDADILTDRIEADRIRLISAMSAWETVSGLCRTHAYSMTTAQDILKRYAATGGFDYVQIGEREYGLATQAYADYGNGRHPAALNMGNCFAYACAKSNRAALLFTGDHFTKTDITAALLS